jgi:hypothetical protein
MTHDHFETISPEQLETAIGGLDAGAIAQKVGNVGGKIQKIAGIVGNVIGAIKGLGGGGAGAGAAPQQAPQGGCPGGHCGGGG